MVTSCPFISRRSDWDEKVENLPTCAHSVSSTANYCRNPTKSYMAKKEEVTNLVPVAKSPHSIRFTYAPSSSARENAGSTPPLVAVPGRQRDRTPRVSAHHRFPFPPGLGHHRNREILTPHSQRTYRGTHVARWVGTLLRTLQRPRCGEVDMHIRRSNTLHVHCQLP